MLVFLKYLMKDINLGVFLLLHLFVLSCDLSQLFADDEIISLPERQLGRNQCVHHYTL